MERITLTKVLHLAQDVQRKTPKTITMSCHRCHKEENRNIVSWRNKNITRQHPYKEGSLSSEDNA